MFLDRLLLAEADKKFLNNFVNMANMPHALLLDAAGVGMDRELPLAMAQYLLCHSPQHGDYCGECDSCKAVSLGVHPDLQIVSAEEKANKVIKIEQIKTVIAKLDYAANLSKIKICLINDVHFMNSEAANSLLKALEEPKGRSLFLFTTDRKERILPTILSRLIVWRLHPPEPAVIWQALAELEPAEDTKRTLIKLTGGDVHRIKELATPELLDLKQTAADFVQALAQGRLWQESAGTDQARSKWAEVAQKNKLPIFLFFLTYYLRDLLLLKNNCTDLVYNIDYISHLKELQEQISKEQIFKALKILAEAGEMLAVNINAKMLLDNIFIQLM